MPSLKYDEIEVGTRGSVTKQVTGDDIKTFAELSLDDNPVHLDDEFAANTRFGKRIAHGMFSAGLISSVLGAHMPGYGTIYLSQELSFKAPVFMDDTLTAYAEVVEKMDKKRVRLRTWVENQDGKIVVDGEATTLLSQG